MDNKHINFVKKIEYRTCPDILVGNDKEFWFSKKERIKHKNELNIFDSLKTRKKDELIIVIILESPHISEFSTKREDDFFDDKILANPALGKTGNNLQKYFTHNNLNNLIEKSIHDLHKYKKYKVILMNSIQYQCSLGCNPKKYRDHNWIQYWFSQGKEEFLERLQIYNPDIIFNLCTKGNHQDENNNAFFKKNNCKTVINGKYINYCVGKKVSLTTKNTTIRQIVSNYIIENIDTISYNKGIYIFEGNHPSSWYKNDFNSIKLIYFPK